MTDLKFDEENMAVTFTLWGEDENEEVHTLPVGFIVCTRCNGKGTHVNPSIDGNGLTREDFAEDPDFREDYFNGVFDVGCYTCHGNRVEWDFFEMERYSKEHQGVLTRYYEDQESSAVCKVEMAMGA